MEGAYQHMLIALNRVRRTCGNNNKKKNLKNCSQNDKIFPSLISSSVSSVFRTGGMVGTSSHE